MSQTTSSYAAQTRRRAARAAGSEIDRARERERENRLAAIVLADAAQVRPGLGESQRRDGLRVVLADGDAVGRVKVPDAYDSGRLAGREQRRRPVVARQGGNLAGRPSMGRSSNHWAEGRPNWAARAPCRCGRRRSAAGRSAPASRRRPSGTGRRCRRRAASRPRPGSSHRRTRSPFSASVSGPVRGPASADPTGPWTRLDAVRSSRER